jgi:hypothetical protein
MKIFLPDALAIVFDSPFAYGRYCVIDLKECFIPTDRSHPQLSQTFARR